MAEQVGVPAPTQSENDVMNSTPFSLISPATNPQKIIDNADGYVYWSHSIYKAPFTDVSNLMLLNCEFCDA